MAYNFIFIDDEDLIRENLQYMVEWDTLGFSFNAAFENSKDALLYMETHQVDLVLSDIVLKNETGLDLAKKIRDKYPSTLVILISAHKDFEFAKKAIDLNVFSYLTKPTSYEDIIVTFERVKAELDKRDSVNSLSSHLYYEVHYHSMIKKALGYINEHFLEDITRNDVAKHLDITPEYFSRYFKKYTNKKFVDYLNELRINYAMQLLQDPNLKVYEICTTCCYKSMHYFLTLFKQYTGLTPNEFRSQLHKNQGDNIV